MGICHDNCKRKVSVSEKFTQLKCVHNVHSQPVTTLYLSKLESAPPNLSFVDIDCFK